MKKRIKHQFEKIKDETVRQLASDFIADHPEMDGQVFPLALIRVLADRTIEDLDWHFFSVEMFSLGESRVRTYFKFFIAFMFYLIDLHMFVDVQNEEACLENRNCLMNFEFYHKQKEAGSHDRFILDTYPDGFNHITPYSFICYTGYKPENGKKSRGCRNVIVDNIDSSTNSLISNFLSKKRKENDTIAGTVMTVLFANKHNLKSEDFNDVMLEEHLNILLELKRKDALVYSTGALYPYAYTLINFYLFIQDVLGPEKTKERFHLYNETVLTYQYFASNFEAGYKVIHHNKFDPVPDSDKWILIKPESCTDKKTIQCVDFTPANAAWRPLLKEYYWSSISAQYKDATKRFYSLFNFVNVVAENHKEIDITASDLFAYKKVCINQNITPSSVIGRLSQARQFIKYLKNNGTIQFNEILLAAFDYVDSPPTSKPDPFTKEDLIKLLDQYRKDYEECANKIKKQRFLLEYYFLVLLAITEMRKASILVLRTDSLVTTLHGGREEYAVFVPSKMSNGQDDRYNITLTAGKIIKEIIRITEEDRKAAEPKYRDKLFICRREMKRNIECLSERTMDSHLRAACAAAGIEYKSFDSIRDTFMNEVEEFIERNHLSQMLLPALTKHSAEIHHRNYVPINIKQLCANVYHVDVGSFNLRSVITESEIDSPVMNNCGGCTLKKCALKNNYDCLMCENFVTTPDHLEYFKKEIERIDGLIMKQEIPHEVEFLQIKKKLLVTYVAEIMAYKEAHV